MELDEKIIFDNHTYSGRSIEVVYKNSGTKESLLFYEDSLNKALHPYLDGSKKLVTEEEKSLYKDAIAIDTNAFAYIPKSVLGHDDMTVLIWCKNNGFDFNLEDIEPANGTPKELTWDDLYIRALETGFGSAELTAKDNARAYIGNYAKEHFGIDIEAAEIPEEEIDWFLEEHPELNRFDENGRMLIDEIEKNITHELNNYKKENKDMDMDKVIAKVEWTVQDVADAFSDKYGRKPANNELDILLQNLNTKGMEELATEYGWEKVNDAIYESRNQINDMTKTESEKLQNIICDDFEITKEDLSNLITEINESNNELKNRELNEEIAFRLIEESVDMHGFESQLGGKAVFENEANPENKTVVISDTVNSQIMEAHSEIIEKAANGYISGNIKFNALQEFIDEHLKENELYKGFEKTGVLTDLIQDNKELKNGTHTRIYSFAPFGYEGNLVSLETDLRRGIPAYDIVGISDGVVKETRERIYAAIINSGIKFPPERILQSFSPADLRKDGGMELAAALDMLNVFQTNSTYQNKPKNFIEENVLVLGNLNLSGQIEPVRGAFAAVKTAAAAGINHVICNNTNFMEISSVPGIKVSICDTLNDAIRAIESRDNFKEVSFEQNVSEGVSFSDDVEKPSWNPEGYYKTARAIEVAIAGKHNLLLVGAPGCGKTTAIQNLVPYLTPCLTDNELQSVNRINSLAGLTNPRNSNSKNAPFRMPHQTSSIEGMCGGGPNCRPGEITLSHNGILFLDEAAEFKSSVLQMLRVPMEQGTITLSRAGRVTQYPAKHQLIMAASPCPCCNYGCSGRTCLDSARSINIYWNKFPGPVLDKIAVREFVEKNEKDSRTFDVEKARECIKKAYEIQRKRGTYNNDLTKEQLNSLVVLDGKGKDFYKKIVETENLSYKEVINMLRLSLTIANIDGRENVLSKDLKEAYNMVLPVFEKGRSVNVDKQKNVKKEIGMEGR